MIGESEELLIADLAEYYGILDYKTVSPDTVATLLVMLRPESRIKMKYSEARATFSQLLMAQALDCLNILIWQNTKNGHKGRKRPKSLYKRLLGDEDRQEYDTFESPEDFESWRKARFNNGG